MATLMRGWVLVMAMAGTQAAAQQPLPTAEDALRDAIQAAQEAKDAAEAGENVVAALESLVEVLEWLEAGQESNRRTERAWVEGRIDTRGDALEERVKDLRGSISSMANTVQELQATHETQKREHARRIRRLEVRIDALEIQDGQIDQGTQQTRERQTRRNTASSTVTGSGNKLGAKAVGIALYKKEFGSTGREILSVVNATQECIKDWQGALHYSVAGQSRRFASMQIGVQGLLRPGAPVMVRKGEYGEEQGIDSSFAYKDAKYAGIATTVYDVSLETTGGSYVAC